MANFYRQNTQTFSGYSRSYREDANNSSVVKIEAAAAEMEM